MGSPPRPPLQTPLHLASRASKKIWYSSFIKARSNCRPSEMYFSIKEKSVIFSPSSYIDSSSTVFCLSSVGSYTGFEASVSSSYISLHPSVSFLYGPPFFHFSEPLSSITALVISWNLFSSTRNTIVAWIGTLSSGMSSCNLLLAYWSRYMR